MDEAKQLLISIEESINTIRSKMTDAAHGEVDRDDYSYINKQLDDLKIKTRQAISENIDIKEERDRFRSAYSRYRLEYDKLMNSGSVKALLKAREIIGRRYDVLPPSVLQVDFDVTRGEDDDLLFTQLVGSASDLLLSSEALDGRFDSLQTSNGQRMYEKAPLTIGLISESAIPKWLSNSLNCVPISEDLFESQIDSHDFDAIILMRSEHASCLDRSAGPNAPDWASSALAYAGRKGISTIALRNVNMSDSSVSLTVQSDKVCDTSIDLTIPSRCIPESNDGVKVWINPEMNNPLNINAGRSNLDSYLDYMFLYRGVWDDKEAMASQECAMIFNGIVDSPFLDLCIACPSSMTLIEPRWFYSFPFFYRPYIFNDFEDDYLSNLCKLFRYRINISWNPYLENAYYREIHENLACGTIVVSNYSRLASMNALPIFPVFDPGEMNRLVDGYTDQELFNMQVENSRNVLSGKTVYDWLNAIFEHIGADFRFGCHKVLLVCSKKKLSSSASKELMQNENVVIVDREVFEPSKPLDAFDFFFLASDDMLDYEYFLEDALNCFKYTDVDYVTYDCSSGYKDSYRYTNGDVGISDTLYSLKGIEINSLLEHAFRSSLAGFKISPTKWGRSTAGEEKKIGVIIPVYNNGKYLKERCFPSLLRSSVFGNMQIYLMDDGSNDEITIKTIAELCNTYDNVVSHRCGDKGSGSASLPRNEGLRLCNEPYVTYLDPDNEAIGDGYAKLLEALEGESSDFAIGNMVVVMDPPSDSYIDCDSYEPGRNDNPQEALIETSFAPKSIQACLTRRDFLVRNAIENVVGAVGQDSLFFTEMMLASQSFIYLNSPIHVYFAERQGSVVNSVSHEFFKKSFLTEKRQANVLKEHGVLDDYKELRLDFFVDNWYKKKLTMVADSEKEQSMSIIERIRDLYN